MAENEMKENDAVENNAEMINVYLPEYHQNIPARTTESVDDINYKFNLLNGKKPKDFIGMFPFRQPDLSEVKSVVFDHNPKQPEKEEETYHKKTLDELGQEKLEQSLNRVGGKKRGKNYVAPFFKGAGSALYNIGATIHSGLKYMSEDAGVAIFNAIHDADVDLTAEQQRSIRQYWQTQEEIREKLGLKLGKYDSQFSGDLGGGIASMVVALMSSAAYKSPNAAAMVFGMSKTGDVYARLREKGVSAGEALPVATGAGVVEGGIERIGLPIFLRTYGSAVLKRKGNVIKTIIKQGGIEFLQEGSQSLSGNFLMAPYEEGYQWKKWIDDALYEGVLAAVTAPVAGAATYGMTGELRAKYADMYHEKLGLDEQQSKNLAELTVLDREEAIDVITEIADNETIATLFNDNAVNDAEQTLKEGQDLLDKLLAQKAMGLSDEVQAKADEFAETMKQQALSAGESEDVADATSSMAGTLIRNIAEERIKRGLTADKAVSDLMVDIVGGGNKAVDENLQEVSPDIFALTDPGYDAVDEYMTPEQRQNEIDEERIATMVEDGGMSVEEATFRVKTGREPTELDKALGYDFIQYQIGERIRKIDAERLAFERKDINPDLIGRESEVKEAVDINRFFADRKASKEIGIDEVMAAVDANVRRNENGVRVLKNSITGETVTLSNSAISKMFSSTSNRLDSQNIGGILGKEAIANIGSIFDTAMLIKTTPDAKHGSKNKIRRYANVIRSDGENFIVKMTVKEMANKRPELTDIEIEDNGGRDLSAYDMKVGRKNTAEGNISGDKSPTFLNGNDISINDLIDFVNSYSEDSIQINGKKRAARNSAGRRIARTEEGLRAFYEWFGDSLIVDENGRPLVVYHGTNAEFDVFDKGKIKRGIGFWFSSNKETSKEYGNIKEFYLSVKNPIDVNKNRSDFIKLAKEAMPEIPNDVSEHYIISDALGSTAFKEYLQNQGYDAISLGDSYVVFNPNQIKSVDNRGSFSRTDDNIYYQFAGEKALTADTNSLSQARTMELNDYSDEEIYKETGWFRGKDNKWRFEISDDEAVFDLSNVANDTTVTLDSILQHDKLFAAYPELRNLSVMVDSNMKDGDTAASFQRGVWDEEYGWLGQRISINPDILYRKDIDLKSILMHEIQHALQRKEGFATGGAPSMFFDKENMPIFQHFFQEQDNKKFNQAVLDALYGELSVDAANKISDADDKYLAASEKYINAIGEKEETQAEEVYNDAEQELNNALAEAGKNADWFAELKAKAREDAGLDRLGKSKRAKNYNPWDLYKQLYGEIEARNTQARMDMSEEERRSTPPEETQDIKNADAIVVWEDGTVMAYVPENKNYQTGEPGEGELNLETEAVQGTAAGRSRQNRMIYRVMGQYEPAKKLITLFQGKDTTTLTHELLHHYLPIYLTELEKAGRFDKLEGLYKELGVSRMADMGREEWEKLVDLGTSYIFYNQAPNEASKSIFERAKQWMMDAYNTVKKFVKPSPEVTKFFDGLFARDASTLPDVSDLKGRTAELAKILQGAKNGQELTVNGLSLRDISRLRQALYARVPSAGKTLADEIRSAGGIDTESELARQLGYDSRKGTEGGFWNYKGTIKDESQLIDFLKANGYLEETTENTYEETSSVWDKIQQLIDRRNDTYNEKEQSRQMARDSALAAGQVVSEILNQHYIGDVKKLEEDLRAATKMLADRGAVAVDKATLDYLTFSLKQMEKDYQRLLYQKKEERYNYQEKLTKFIKDLPLDYNHKSKFMDKIRMVKDEKSFNKYLKETKERAEKYIEQEQRRMLSDLIQSEVKSSRPRKVMAQKYDYENNVLFKDLRDYNKMTQSEAAAALAALDETEQSVDNPGSRGYLLRRLFLEYKANGMDSSSELMRQLYEMIGEAKQLGRESKEESEFEKSFEREQDRQQIIDKLDASKADKNKWTTMATNVYRRGITNLYSMLNSIAGKEIADKYEMETVIDRKEQKEWKHLKKTSAKAEVIYKVKSYGDLLNVMADKGQEVAVLYGKDGKKYDLSVLDIIDIYNAIKNKKTRQDYEEAYGAEQINRLISLLSPEDRAFGDMLMEDVNSRFSELNKVYVRIYGMDLKKVENYWMGSAEHVEPVDIFNDFRQQSTTPGFFKERKTGKVTPVAKNAWIKYQKHISQSYYMTDVAEKYKQLADIFKSKRIENQIENHFGSGVYQTLRKQIENIGLNAQSPRLDDVSGYFQKLLNNWVGAKVSVNPVVFVGQLTSFTNYAEGVNLSAFIKNIGYALAHPIEVKDFMMKYNGDFLQHRYEAGFNEAMSRFIEGAKETNGKNFGLSAKAKFNYSNALSSFVRIGDLGAIIYGGYGQFKTLLDSGMSVEEARRKFEFSTLRSQQSGNAASISDWQQQRGIARLYLAFKNTSLQYTRKIADTVIMLQNGDISREEAAKVLTNYLLIQPAFWVIAKNIAKSLLGLGDDDDEFDDGVLEQLLANPIDGVPFVSDMVRYAYREAAGEKNYSLFSTPLLDDVEKSFRKIGKKDKDFYDFADIVTPFIEMLTSAPAGTAKRYMKIYNEKWGE